MPAGSSTIFLCRNRVSGGSPFIGLIGQERWGFGSWVDVMAPDCDAGCTTWVACADGAGTGGSTGGRCCCGGPGRRGGSSRNPLFRPLFMPLLSPLFTPFIGGRGRCGGGGGIGAGGRGARRLVSTSRPIR